MRRPADQHDTSRRGTARLPVNREHAYQVAEHFVGCGGGFDPGFTNIEDIFDIFGFGDMFGQRQQTTALAAKYRLPAIYPLEIFIPEGGLIAYGIERVDMFHRTADYVDRILRGSSPTELLVQQPTKFELAINLKTAKSLGLSVPPSMLLSADEVIE